MNSWPVVQFFAGCFVWVPIAICLVSLVNWMVMGEVDFLTGIAACFLCILLGYLTVKPPYPQLSLVFFLVVCAMVFFFAPMRAAIHAAQLAAIDREQAARAYELLAKNPANVIATYRIARLLAERGLLGHAIALMDAQLTHMSANVFPEELNQLRRWKSLPPPSGASRELPCLRCQHRVAPGSVRCPRCANEFLLDYIGSGGGRKAELHMLAAWVSVALITAAIPLAAKYLPLGLALAAIAVSLAAGTAIIIRAFTQRSIQL